MRQADVQWEWVQQVEVRFQARRFLFRTLLQAQTSQAIRAAGVALPLTFTRAALKAGKSEM